MEFFDSHCHFDFEVFAGQRAQLWRRCQAAGIARLLVPGVAPAQWQAMLVMAEAYRGIVCAVGLHPWWIDKVPGDSAALADNVAAQAALKLSHPRCVAVGECGLDTYIETPLALQQAVFEAQVQLAGERRLPLVVHVRGAHQQVIRILRRNSPAAGGVIHGFSGSPELAAQYWALGFYIGVGGTITYERAAKTRRAVCALPAEALVLETDAPDIPLCGFQGQPNTPLQIPRLARVLAELRQQSLSAVAAQTSANSCRLFGLGAPGTDS